MGKGKKKKAVAKVPSRIKIVADEPIVPVTPDIIPFSERYGAGQTVEDPIYKIIFCAANDLQRTLMEKRMEMLSDSRYFPPKAENIKVLTDGRIMVLFEKNIY